MNVFDVVIIGAGLSGLMAGRLLRSRGLRVVLLDKGRSVGGRLATRRIGPGRADHGAQFFTARAPEFRSWVERWLAAGLVYQWSAGWSDGSLHSSSNDGHPRYAVRGGMNALAKKLAEDLDIWVNTRATGVQRGIQGWETSTDQGHSHHSRAVLLTAPVPQSLAVLKAGSGTPDSDHQLALQRIAYAPCLAGLFWMDRAPNLPAPGALQRAGADVAWIADNQRKGISPEATLVTIHAGPEASRQRYDDPEEKTLAWLQAELQPFLSPGTQVREAQLKRWRYALPTMQHEERFLMPRGLPLLAFAGDAFGGPRVEGAALSGLAAGEALAQRLAAAEP